MKMPAKALLSTLEAGKIYFFTMDIDSPTAGHRHIFLKKKGEEFLIFVCCTSQEDTMNRLIQRQRLDPATIVWIRPDAENGLTKDTFVNCNFVVDLSIDEFIAAYDEGYIQSTGGNQISDAVYAQIVYGIKHSILFAEEIKECLGGKE